MSDRYRLFGSELSPFSVKVRSYMRFKGLPHDWIIRGPDTMETFQAYAKLPLVPLLVTPDDEGWQDSTPIVEMLEAAHPEPALQPEDPTVAFLSALIEEYGDEWVNKPMFHYRWRDEADQISASERIAAQHMGAGPDMLGDVAAKVRQRMVPRVSFVGSSPETAPIIEKSLDRVLAILEAHLADHDYLFGGRLCLGDLGLFAQLYQCSTDPTLGSLMGGRGPRTLDWIARLIEPEPGGDFAAWEELAPTLAPLFKDEIAGLFLPWSTANAAAIEAGEETFSVTLADGPFSQAPQKYHARSLAEIRRKYATAASSELDAILGETGCLAYL
jgi:glutathione S-transferase